MSEENIKYIILVVITLSIASILSYLIRKSLGFYTRKSAKLLKTDPTKFSFLRNSVSFIIYSIAFIFIFNNIPYLEALGNTLFAGAGIFAVVIGFAAQTAFGNIVSGVFILLFKPFGVEDIIEFIDGHKGVVEEITLRHTVIRDYENRRIVIPNSRISEETIINSSLTDEKTRKHIVLSISYESNIDKAISIIREIVKADPRYIDNRTEQQKQNGYPEIPVRVYSLSDYSVDLKIYVWAKDNDDAFLLQCDLLKTVKERFDKEGIEIPYPHRTVVYKKDSSLS